MDASLTLSILELTEGLTYLFIFVLAAFIGFELISKVPTTLHTPLMSGSNAISGIILIGAIMVARQNTSGFATVLGLLGVFFATINVVGGFAVTDRMLRMFGGKKKREGAGS